MAEPQLPADVPVAQAVHPVEVDALVALRVPADLARFARCDGAVAHLLHAEPPLLADERLDDGVAPVAVPHVVGVRLFLEQQALLLQVFDDQLAGLDAGQSVVAEARDVHAAVEVHAVDDLEVMALPDLVVHRVVPWRDLERARAEFRIHRLVSHDRHLAADQGEDRRLAGDVAIARIVGVHRDSGVGEHRLGADRGNGHVPPTLYRIFDEVEDVVVLLPLDLEVRDG